jgi:hypothetical protein
MKTSNIIILSFLIFLFGGITLLYIGSKYYKKGDRLEDFANHEKTVAPFSVVVAEPGAIFNLRNGKEYKVSQGYKKGIIPNFAPFVVRNDTLFMFAIKPQQIKEELPIVPVVFCKNVKYIIGKVNAYIYLDNYEADSLFVNIDKAKLSWVYDKIIFVSLNAKNSSLNLNGNKIEKIDLKLDKTELDIISEKNIECISGSLKNASNLNCSLDGKINLKADKSSRMSLGNN